MIQRFVWAALVLWALVMGAIGYAAMHFILKWW